MKNYVQPGNTVTLPAPYDVLSGGGLLVDAIFGIASGDAVTGQSVETSVVGVYDMAAETGASTAITVGALIYWDDTAKVVTGTATNNTLIGVALGAKADGEAVVRVRLNGSAG